MNLKIINDKLNELIKVAGENITKEDLNNFKIKSSLEATDKDKAIIASVQVMTIEEYNQLQAEEELEDFYDDEEDED